jgi:hypothetical protein
MENNEMMKNLQESFNLIKNTKGELDFELVVGLHKQLLELLSDENYKDHFDQIKYWLSELEIYRFRYYFDDKFYDFFYSGVEKLLKQGLPADYIVDGIKYFNYKNWDLESYKISREQVLGAFYKNKELLTKEKIVYDNGREEEGSVKNWFKHYQTYFDHNKDLRLGLMDYMDKNKSVIRLTSDEKAALRNFIYIIEYLRAPAEDMIVNEETNFFQIDENTYGLIEDGDLSTFDMAKMRSRFQKFIPASSTTENVVGNEKSEEGNDKAVSNFRQIIQLSESDLLQLKFVTQKYKSLSNEEVINYFWEGLEAYNLDMVLGAVQELITRQQWNDFVVLPRLKLLIKDFNSRQQTVINMDEPRSRLRLFFEWLLEEHLGLTDEKTKKWALYFSNLLLKNNYEQYKNLLVFDKQAQKLKWFEN